MAHDIKHRDLTPFEKAVDLLQGQKRIVILTGAGISVESGIPDFRSNAGLWARFNPFEYATRAAFEASPEKCWQLFEELGATIWEAAPNPAHHALTQWQSKVEDLTVVTQNIDGLHQKAGNGRVLEFHGDIRFWVCLGCEKKLSSDRDVAFPPRCDCGRILKPNIVLFGDPIPMGVWDAAVEAIEGSDGVVVVGTSAQVAPFSELPVLAARLGLPVIEINLVPTGLTNLPTLFLQGSAGDILPALVARLEKSVDDCT